MTNDPQVIIEYVDNSGNGLFQTIKQNEIQIKVKYRPHQLMAYQEYKSQTPPSKPLVYWDSLFGGYDYFMVSLDYNGEDYVRNGSIGFDGYSEMLNNINFHMDKFSFIIANRDTLPLVDSFTPNLMGHSKSTDILLVFPKNNANQFSLQLNNLGYDMGKQAFVFKRKDIDNIPQLKI